MPRHDCRHSIAIHLPQEGWGIRTLRGLRKILSCTAILVGMFMNPCWAQDLAPRAYLITPLHSNAINLTYSFYDGGLEFNG